MIINTHGHWIEFEKVTKTEFETGKTYEIDVDGNCEFALSDKEPQVGFITNKLIYTHHDGVTLWIKTKQEK